MYGGGDIGREEEGKAGVRLFRVWRVTWRLRKTETKEEEEEEESPFPSSSEKKEK